MTTTAIPPTLTAHDRCDRCGAQAYVKVRVSPYLNKSTLLFCAHHMAVHEDKLKAEGAVTLIDDRQRLEAEEATTRT